MRVTSEMMIGGLISRAPRVTCLGVGVGVGVGVGWEVEGGGGLDLLDEAGDRLEDVLACARGGRVISSLSSPYLRYISARSPLDLR